MPATLSVQLTDMNGEILRDNIENIHGLRPGIGVQIQGKVDPESLPNAMLINVNKFKIKN